MYPYRASLDGSFKRQRVNYELVVVECTSVSPHASGLCPVEPTGDIRAVHVSKVQFPAYCITQPDARTLKNPFWTTAEFWHAYNGSHNRRLRHSPSISIGHPPFGQIPDDPVSQEDCKKNSLVCLCTLVGVTLVPVLIAVLLMIVLAYGRI